MSVGAHGESIPPERCWELLSAVSVGRIALSLHALPQILPVQYYVRDRRLLLCLGHRGVPLAALDGAVVAFAADSIDPADRAGWSVQVLGRSSFEREVVPGADCGQPTAGQIVQLQVASVTGQFVHLCPLVDRLRLAAH